MGGVPRGFWGRAHGEQATIRSGFQLIRHQALPHSVHSRLRPKLTRLTCP